jgi:signal transduction histidine kinase
MSLHRSLSLFVTTLAILALGAAGSLVVLTKYLHRVTVDLEAGLHSVRLAEEMQIDLLTYVRTQDHVIRTSAEHDLREKLSQARRYVSVPEEDAALAQAAMAIEAYFARTGEIPAVDGNSILEGAFSALNRFVDVNVEQAETSLRESERWDDLGDKIGIGVGAGLILGVTVMLIWLRVFAFRPVFEIRDVMKEFATGSRHARAPEHGPEELRSIAAQFNDMADALARQHENQLAFIAAVAHDLRNPLSALEASADILSFNETIPADRLSDLMSVIKRQVRRLDRLVGDLLDGSRIEAGRLELRVEKCDGRILARDAFDLFSSTSKQHQFALNLPESPIAICCDPLRVEQVLNNLISNAVKYSPDGGEIAITAEQCDHEVLFQVSDQGLGIPEAELPYIFEPFRRTPMSREEIPGVGLGLSVARRIVQAHGGRIQADSEVGKGTIFRVYLPVSPNFPEQALSHSRTAQEPNMSLESGAGPAFPRR